MTILIGRMNTVLITEKLDETMVLVKNKHGSVNKMKLERNDVP